MKRIIINVLFITFFGLNAQSKVYVGAESTGQYFPMLKGKRIAVMSNHTGMVVNEHLVDMLVRNKFNVTVIFSPEHGFRGDVDAGGYIGSSIDKKTGIPIKSLYDGKGQKPDRESMNMFDIMVIDIQDVGLRFYTYYITMVRLMDVCTEYGKKVIVLDRPNPNGHYVDGPILDMKYKSGVGWLPVPIVHGLTLGELALMTNGEGWLPQGRKCNLTVIKCKNYNHKTLYQLPVAPSPNLPNMKSVYLYPSTCLFEGTPVSLGRGTKFPFQVYGHPGLKGFYKFSFIPRSIPGAKHPPLLNQKCYGLDLRNVSDELIFENGLDLTYVIDAYRKLNMGNKFFTPLFEKLVGVDYIRKMIIDGKSAEDIRKMWKKDVENFKKQRKPYLLYEE
jgi:uncharacterized protein YbbC (DUF1343 family)